jgi:hypothetical protein
MRKSTKWKWFCLGNEIKKKMKDAKHGHPTLQLWPRQAIPVSNWSPGCHIPILHTVWLDSHALTLKNYTAKYYDVRKI